MTAVPLIPRRLFFGNPDRAAVRLSPDGKHLSWLAPLDGLLNVWVAPRQNLTGARPLTHDAKRGIKSYFWAHTNRHLLYSQDKNGDENVRLYVVDLETGDVRDLTPFDGVQARLEIVGPEFPEEIVVGLNNRDPKWHDLHRINLVTGKITLLLQNDRFAEVAVDHDYRPRVACEMTADGGVKLFIADRAEWRDWGSIAPADQLTTSIIGFDRSNTHLLMKDSRGRDTSALVEINLETKASRILAADPKRIAVMGGSFGGYSTLAGLTFHPELFACGVDLVGVSNLVTFIESIPAYWKPMLDLLINRIGDPRTEEGRALLKQQSPLTFVERIRKPLLIGQGANDPRVKQAESDQIVQAMQARNIPVTYLLYPDEGHGFYRPENNLSFFAIAEGFLAKCLGGRCEPIGNDCQGSSLQVLTGMEGIPGLEAALAYKT